MLSTTQFVTSSMIVLALLQLVSSGLLSSIFVQLCILISLGFLMTGLTRSTFNTLLSVLASPPPFSLSQIKVPSLDPFHGSIATIIAFASAVIKPLYSITIIVLVWTVGHSIGLFLRTSVHFALVLFPPKPSKSCKCTVKREHEEAPTVVKVEHSRSRDADTVFVDASRRLDDFCDTCASAGPSGASDVSTCTDETDIASSSAQDSADSSFGDPDGSPNSTWHSDATSASLLSDSDICSIAARFNHALVRKRFCVEGSLFCTPAPGCHYELATEIGMAESMSSNQATDSGSDFVNTLPPLGDVLSPSFSSTSISAQSPAPSSAPSDTALDFSSSCSLFGMSPSPTHASSNLSSVFSTSFIAVARATSGSRSAPISRRSSFSSSAPLFRPLSLFASSTSSDVSLASTSPSPSRPRSMYGRLMPLPSSADYSFTSSSSSLADFFFDTPEFTGESPPSPPFSPSVSAYSCVDVPISAPWIPASLSAWYLAEGRPVAHDCPSHPLRIFGIPAEELSENSYSLYSRDFSAKDEAYLCAALGLYEPTSVPRCGFFWASSGGSLRSHPSRREWYGWVFPGRGAYKPTFVPEEIPVQAPYDEHELAYLWARWGYWPTTAPRPEYMSGYACGV